MPERFSAAETTTSLPLTILVSATILAKQDLPEAEALLLDRGRREAIYVQNLHYWHQVLPPAWGITFVENSLAPLDELAQSSGLLVGNRPVELISFQGNEFPSAFGKGYGEARLLDHAFSVSTLLPRSRLVAKITGLQTVANLAKMVDSLPIDSRWVADLREHSVYRLLRSDSSGAWCDTRLFFTTADFFLAHLSGIHKDHRAGHFFLETAYYQKMRALMGRSGVHPRFPIEPVYRGPAGHWGKDYGRFRQRAKQLVRGALRRLVPALWI